MNMVRHFMPGNKLQVAVIEVKESGVFFGTKVKIGEMIVVHEIRLKKSGRRRLESNGCLIFIFVDADNRPRTGAEAGVRLQYRKEFVLRYCI